MFLWLVTPLMSIIHTLLFVDDKGGENCANIIYAENYRFTGTNSGGDHIQGEIQNYVVINQKGGEC